MNNISKLIQKNNELSYVNGYLRALNDVMDLINSGKTGEDLVLEIAKLSQTNEKETSDTPISKD